MSNRPNRSPFQEDIELQNQRISSRRNSDILNGISQFAIDDDDVNGDLGNPYFSRQTPANGSHIPLGADWSTLSWKQKLTIYFSQTRTKKRVFIVTVFFLIVWSILLLGFARAGNLKNTDEYLPEVGKGTDAYAGVGSSNDTHSSDGLKKMSLDEQRIGSYYAFHYSLNFVNVDDKDGYYIHDAGSYDALKKVDDSEFETKLYKTNTFEYKEEMYNFKLKELSKDGKRAIVVTNEQSLFRHSGYGIYWILEIESEALSPVHKVDKENVKTSFAAFSPNGNYVSFVEDNNLYVKDLKTNEVLQVTDDGNDNIFNGRPDWVYEEEVLADDKAVFWSQDETKVAYIKFDDTKVPEYDLEMFGDDTYPHVEKLKYPKPGYKNPVVSVHVYSIADKKSTVVDHSDSKLGDDFVVYDIAWITKDELLIKETDRVSKKIDVRLYNGADGSSKVIRSADSADYNGWYVNNGHFYVLPNGKGYIDTVVDNNFDHLGYFKTATTVVPEVLTNGEFDVIGGTLGYDANLDALYYIGATGGNAAQRQLYKIKLSEGAESVKSLTDDTQLGAYDVKVSTGGKYASISYRGPNLPNTKVVELSKMAEDKEYYKSVKPLQDNAKLQENLALYAVPTKKYITVTLDDETEISVQEVRPPNFDSSKKYSLLVSIYGGPGSQKINANFNYGFEEVVSSSLNTVVWYIEPRGTGSKGWKYKAYAKKNIGFWEPRDVVETTKKLIKENSYINADKTAIWGWSYGGFTTLKTLEFDAGSTFKYGMAVAPVTDWTLYDSIYTERYMDLPTDNENYKATAKISDYKKFKQVSRFLLMHGTGDDNVHIQNSMHLLDGFNLNGVENYDMRVFPDSNHNIAYHNANTIVYDQLYNWLQDAYSLKFIDMN
ncbi:unnamed protein product [Ambrosiozyma monospora]|uniref:Unnamed protein product n=1 Tax=Ambrosiozyma monospora TaxID=43982 RepID=A0A9W6YPV4_AMBMO|nr:unnamed protein product [Ambrosiozyma monospora]